MPKLTNDCIQRLNQSIPLTGMLTLSQKYRGEYNCPFCGSDHHVKIYPDSNTAKCIHCGKSFDGIQAYQQLRGLDFPAACREIAADKCLTLEYVDGSVEYPDGTKEPTRQDRHTATNAATSKDSTVDSEKSLKTANTASDGIPQNVPNKYKDFCDNAAAGLFSADGRGALEYLHGRGLTDETIKKYKLGFYENEIYFPKAGRNMPALIFPHDTDCSYFSARSLTDKFFAKPRQSDAGRQILFNADALRKNEPVFVCESILDAISIEQAGGNALALTGTAWKDVFLSQIESQKPESVLVLCMDNDEPGRQAQADLAAYLDEKGIPYITAGFDLDRYPQGMKDANDLLQADAAQLAADVKRIKKDAERALRPDNVLDYIRNTMHGEIMENCKDATRQTGFANLDYHLNALYSGLYFVGGGTGSGKTSWTWQLADNLAKQGNHVLYFSLEMTETELVTKSLARYSAILDPDHALTSAQIRMGRRSQAVEKAAKKYMRDTADRISIIRGDFNYSVSGIDKYIDAYIKRNNVKPCVIIDYLQILSADIDPETGRKTTDVRQITNENVTKLKRLSRKYRIPVITISALNRENYNLDISFESFRESSGIEFSADCVLGLQLCAIHDEIMLDDKATKTDKRDHMNYAESQDVRHVEIKCLKNRWGKSKFTCYFDYRPGYDLFEIPESDVPPKNAVSEWRETSDSEQLEMELLFN